MTAHGDHIYQSSKHRNTPKKPYKYSPYDLCTIFGSDLTALYRPLLFKHMCVRCFVLIGCRIFKVCNYFHISYFITVSYHFTKLTEMTEREHTVAQSAFYCQTFQINRCMSFICTSIPFFTKTNTEINPVD